MIMNEFKWLKNWLMSKKGKAYIPFFHINDLEITFDYLCTYWIKHFTPTSVEYCRMNLYSMSWQTQNISWLIVAIFCHNPASYMLEFDFHVLILHLTSLHSCVNNLMHIPANYSCDSRTVLIDMTQDLCILIYLCVLYWNSAMNCTCICICVLCCLCWICVLYYICCICVLYYNVNIYFVITHYHFL